MMNAKNVLHDFLKNLGYSESVAKFNTFRNNDEYTSKVVLELNDGYHAEGTGRDEGKTDAEIAASANLYAVLKEQRIDLFIDWEQIRMEAQAGDALIKLSAYLNPMLKTPAEKSNWLQDAESDGYMVEVFDGLKSSKDESVLFLGNNLGQKRKATYVEALIWRRFGSTVLDTSSIGKLMGINGFLGLE